MKILLLKDKYLNCQFPKKYKKKPNKKKTFIENFIEKMEILDNPFNNRLKSVNTDIE